MKLEDLIRLDTRKMLIQLFGPDQAQTIESDIRRYRLGQIEFYKLLRKKLPEKITLKALEHVMFVDEEISDYDPESIEPFGDVMLYVFYNGTEFSFSYKPETSRIPYIYYRTQYVSGSFIDYDNDINIMSNEGDNVSVHVELPDQVYDEFIRFHEKVQNHIDAHKH